jgi:hypothetical protein
MSSPEKQPTSFARGYGQPVRRTVKEDAVREQQEIGFMFAGELHPYLARGKAKAAYQRGAALIEPRSAERKEAPMTTLSPAHARTESPAQDRPLTQSLLHQLDVIEEQLAEEQVSEASTEPYSGPVYGFKRDTTYLQQAAAQPARRQWGGFRAPLRDYERVLNRLSEGTGEISRTELTQFLSTAPVPGAKGPQQTERSIAQILLAHFDRVASACPVSNPATIDFADILAIAEAVNLRIDTPKRENPYILGLSDQDICSFQV